MHDCWESLKWGKRERESRERETNSPADLGPDVSLFQKISIEDNGPISRPVSLEFIRRRQKSPTLPEVQYTTPG